MDEQHVRAIVAPKPLNNDGVFATVRITAMFKESPEAPWLEEEAETDCRKEGGEWQAAA